MPCYQWNLFSNRSVHVNVQIVCSEQASLYPATLVFKLVLLLTLLLLLFTLLLFAAVVKIVAVVVNVVAVCCCC